MRRLGLALAALLLAGAAAANPDPSPGPAGPERGAWRDQLHWVPVPGTGRLIQLRTCRPGGAAAARLVVVNHGSPPVAAARGGVALRRCEDPAIAWFLRRGFAVAQPLRRGYGVSAGAWAEGYGTCGDPDFVRAGRESARDIRAAIAYAAALPGIAEGGVVAVGQSAGGWGVIALAAANPPGVAAVVSMAGGRGGWAHGVPRQTCTPSRLIAAAAEFGRTARVPALWVYAANDSYFEPALAAALHHAFLGAGGVAELRPLPPFGEDGHTLFFARDGAEIWGPPVEAFLRGLGLLDAAGHGG